MCCKAQKASLEVTNGALFYNPGQKSLGQYCNIHIFLSFFGSLLKQCILFEIFLQFSLPPPFTKLKLGKILDTRVQRCCGVRGGVGPVWIAERPRNASVPRLLSMIVGVHVHCHLPVTRSHFLPCDERVYIITCCCFPWLVGNILLVFPKSRLARSCDLHFGQLQQYWTIAGEAGGHCWLPKGFTDNDWESCCICLTKCCRATFWVSWCYCTRMSEL